MPVQLPFVRAYPRRRFYHEAGCIGFGALWQYSLANEGPLGQADCSNLRG